MFFNIPILNVLLVNKDRLSATVSTINRNSNDLHIGRRSWRVLEVKHKIPEQKMRRKKCLTKLITLIEYEICYSIQWIGFRRRIREWNAFHQKLKWCECDLELRQIYPLFLFLCDRPFVRHTTSHGRPARYSIEWFLLIFATTVLWQHAVEDFITFYWIVKLWEHFEWKIPCMRLPSGRVQTENHIKLI